MSLNRLLHPVSFYLHNNFLIYAAICYTYYHSISEVSFTRTKDKQTYANTPYKVPPAQRYFRS